MRIAAMPISIKATVVKAVLAPAVIPLGLPNPIPNRLGRGFDLPCQLFGRSSLLH
jgi:hypothetical protein